MKNKDDFNKWLNEPVNSGSDIKSESPSNKTPPPLTPGQILDMKARQHRRRVKLPDVLQGVLRGVFGKTQSRGGVNASQFFGDAQYQPFPPEQPQSYQPYPPYQPEQAQAYPSGQAQPYQPYPPEQAQAWNSGGAASQPQERFTLSWVSIVLIALSAILAILLIWVGIGLLMNIGVLPSHDLGYNWLRQALQSILD